MWKPHPSVKCQYLTTFKSNCFFKLATYEIFKNANELMIILIYWILQLIKTEKIVLHFSPFLKGNEWAYRDVPCRWASTRAIK